MASYNHQYVFEKTWVVRDGEFLHISHADALPMSCQHFDLIIRALLPCGEHTFFKLTLFPVIYRMKGEKVG